MPMTLTSNAPAAAANSSTPKGELKPIGICLASNSNLDMPTAQTSVAAVNLSNTRNVTNASNSNNFYPSTSVTTGQGQFQMPLSVMVAKLTANPSISTNRQQTVILQPRINQTTRGASLQMNPIRGSAGTAAVISPQTISSSLTSTTPSISVRTSHVRLNGPAQPVPILNLSTGTVSAAGSTGTTGNTTVKQTVLKGPKIIGSSGTVETVNLVMANPNDVRSITRNSATSNDIKNMLTVHNINKVNGPKSVLPNSIVQPKMISINSATGQSTANVCQRFTGIIGPSVTGNKGGIINLTTNIVPKSFIFTSPANATLSGPGTANMVANISLANYVPTGQPTKISVTPNHIITGTTTTRHSAAGGSGNSAHSIITQNNVLSPKATIYTLATTNANVLNSSVSNISTTTISPVSYGGVHQSISASGAITTTTAVTLSATAMPPNVSIVNNTTKSTILAANLSPIKPTMLTAVAPNSPRPRILSRKRLQATDSAITTIKANSAITANGPTTLCANNSTLNIIEQRSLPATLQAGVLTNNNNNNNSNSHNNSNSNNNNHHHHNHHNSNSSNSLEILTPPSAHQQQPTHLQQLNIIANVKNNNTSCDILPIITTSTTCSAATAALATATGIATTNATTTNDINLTPRKKPRKQLLEPTSPNKEIDFVPNALQHHSLIGGYHLRHEQQQQQQQQQSLQHHHHYHQQQQQLHQPQQQQQQQQQLFVEKEPKEPVIILKKPRLRLRPPPRDDKLLKKDNASHHPQYFLKHSDVRFKERKTIPSELYAQTLRPNYTWKLSHMADQLKRAAEQEKLTIQATLENFLKRLETDISPFSAMAANATLFAKSSAEIEKIDIVDRTCVRLNDITRANIQRTKIILDHHNDSKQMLLKLANDHKDKVANLAKRLGSKRHLK